MKKTISALLLALAAQLTAMSAYATPAWTIPSPSGFSNGSWSFGEVFTVGSSNLLLTHLGAFDFEHDGFSTAGGIKVGLFQESTDTLLASTNVLSSDALIGDFRFGDIADIVLSANTTYRVVAVSGSDLYNIAMGRNTDPRLVWNSYGYCNTTALTSCDSFAGTERSWMANMLIEDAAVPEPATLSLLGLSAVALAFARRKRMA